MEEKTYNGRRIYYKPEEVAEMMVVKTVTVYNWCKHDIIPCTTWRGNVRIPIKRFHNWLEDHTTDPK